MRFYVSFIVYKLTDYNLLTVTDKNLNLTFLKIFVFTLPFQVEILMMF